MGFTLPHSISNCSQQLFVNSSGLEEVFLFICDLSKSNVFCSSTFSCLSAEENARANTFLSQKLQLEYKVIHATLRLLLAEILNMDATAIPIKIHSTGKPFIAVSDPKLGQLYFNLSHSGHYGLFAFAWNRQLGIDIEAITAKFSLQDIAGQFFSAKELIMLQSINADNYQEAFFNCWTRKEAYIKAIGDGLSLALDSFSVELRPLYKTQILESRQKNQWQLFDLSHCLPSLDYKAAIVLEA